MADFHFLRPEWLWALIPALLLPLWLWRASAGRHGWHKHIDKDFLPYLQAGQATGKRSFFTLTTLGLLLSIAALALAGPSWERRAVPVEQRGDALVLVVDLSLSMLAEDISPSRIGRARMKLLDILNARREGTTALVVYAGDAHVVTPLSDDSATLAAMVPALSPDIMPALGSQVDIAIEKALQLAAQAGSQAPAILLISDGITAQDVDDVSRLLADSEAVLGVLGVGTTAGGPVPLPNDQGLLRNRDGSIAVPKLSRDYLLQLAQRNAGLYRDISLDDSDWQSLLDLKGEEQSREASERQFDQWLDRGAELSLLVLLGLLPLFRRGVIFSVVLALPLLHSPDSLAESLWDSLWQRPDQRGAQLLQQGDAQAAAEAFDNPEWQAIAHYRAGDYQAAQQTLGDLDSARSHYNRGNALAKTGDYAAAIEAYDKALALDPGNEDAAFNKALVEQLQQQQQQQQQEQQEQQEQQDQQGEQPQDQQGEQQPQDQQGEPQPQDQQGEPQPQDQQGEPQPQDQQGEQQPQDQQGEQQQQDQQQPQDQQGEEGQQEAQAGAFDDLSDEEKQTMEQWLRQIPDDPGGLLRRKFRYQYEQRRLSGQDEVPETWY